MLPGKQFEEPLSMNISQTNIVPLLPHRHVMLPKQLSKLVPASHLMSEEEWRGLGVQQSQGWIHYMIHKPGMYL